MGNYKLILDDEREVFVEKEILLQDIEKLYYSNHKFKIMGFIVNGKIRNLGYKITEPLNNLSVIDLSSMNGIRMYQRSLLFVLYRAVKELYKDAKLEVAHSLSKGLFCEVLRDNRLNTKEVSDIKAKMVEIVSLNEKFVKRALKKSELLDIYEEQNMIEKVELFENIETDEINVYEFGGLFNYFYGELVDSSGILDDFDLMYYDKGFILRHPSMYANGKIPEFEEQKKLAKIHREAESWGDILDVSYVASINKLIDNGDIKSQILTTEALHEKKIIEIADDIYSKKSRIILIAGPSSSGKTTFANRLRIQLKVMGLKPVTISVDDYFVNREFTPLDKDGNYDFESIDAIDRPKFNEDIKSLIDGESIELLKFNFKKGLREVSGETLKISADQPIIIEGIHGLNPVLTESIDDKYKYKIYISCLTQLNIDRHNRVPTTDSRLIRRIVRDNRSRGRDAFTTLNGWDSVRLGEERNIFPFQETADAEFNSATVYELFALKPYVEELLKGVPEGSFEKVEADRLLEFLKFVKPFNEEYEKIIPNTAIVREFIGGNIFH